MGKTLSGASSLKAGDVITIHIKSGNVVSPDEDYEDKFDFEILSKDPEGYFIYIPDYHYLNETKVITNYDISLLKMNIKFLGSRTLYVKNSKIAKIKNKLDGMFCKDCHEFYGYATSNQTDGTLICFSCRHYKHWGSTPDDD